MSTPSRSRSPHLGRTLSSSRDGHRTSTEGSRDAAHPVPSNPAEEMSRSHGRRVYWSFWMLGAAILLSWNVLIISLPTLSSYFPASSPLRKDLTSYIATVFTFGNFGILGVVQVGIAKANQVKRTRLALLCLLLTFLFTSLLLLPFLIPLLSRTFPPTSAVYQTLLFLLLLFLTLSFAFSTSLLQSSVIAIASLWGSNEILAVMSGQGGVAVVVSGVGLYLSVVGALSGKVDGGKADGDGQDAGVLTDSVKRVLQVGQQFTLETVGPTRAEELSTMGVWMIASISILGCYLMTRTVLDERNVRDRMAGRSNREDGGGHVVDRLDEEVISEDSEREGLLREESVEGVVKRLPEDVEVERTHVGSSLEVFKKNIWLNFAVFYVFVVTLALFPPVTTTILSVNKPWPKLLQPGVFIPLHFFIFNVSDFFGRTYMPTFPGFLITNPKRVALLSFSRTLFVPLFLGCNTVFSEEMSRHTPWINSDVVYMLIVAAFGATTGYVTSLSMILSSSPAMNPNITEDEKHIAGTVAGFSLCAGLAAGSLASFGVKGIMGLGSTS